MCCGNGLFTYEFAGHARQVIGIDFVDRNIQNANKWRGRPNITYVLGDVTEPLEHQASKMLIHHSLAYFNPAQLDGIVANIIEYRKHFPFMLLLTGIPRADLKWQYYDTPERRARYLENEAKGPDENDGLGRWWLAEEIQEICNRRGLTVQINNQPPDFSNYRMDALISSRSLG